MSRKEKTAKKGKAQVPEPVVFFSEDLVEAPHADADVGAKVAKQRRVYKIVIYTALVCVPVFTFVSLGTYNMFNELQNAPTAEGDSLETPGKHAAIRAVEDWTAQTPSPLPTGYILSWDGAVLQQEERLWEDENGREQYQHGIELHSFTLATASGAMFSTDVQVAFGEADGATMIGAPTLIPIPPASTSGFSSVNNWVGTMPGSSTESIKDAVNSWVRAYATGDPAALRIAVGDERAEFSYVPLNGVDDFGSVAVGKVAVFPADASVPVNEWQPDPSVAIAQVTFRVAWPGQLNDSRSDINRMGTLTYDVLIERADTASPRIVAWGSAGTGPTLVRYENAVIGKVTLSTQNTIRDDSPQSDTGDRTPEEPGESGGDSASDESTSEQETDGD